MRQREADDPRQTQRRICDTRGVGRGEEQNKNEKQKQKAKPSSIKGGWLYTY